MDNKGLTLVELLLAVALVLMVVFTMAYFLPKAMTAASSSRYITTAKNVAAGEIQTLKQQPYDSIALTPTANNPVIFLISGTGSPGCDCNKESVSTIPPLPDTTVDNNVTFTRHVCINFVNRPSGGTWSADCPTPTSSTDLGLKNIRVWVTWTLNTQGVEGSAAGPAPIQKSIEMESVVSR